MCVQQERSIWKMGGGLLCVHVNTPLSSSPCLSLILPLRSVWSRPVQTTRADSCLDWVGASRPLTSPQQRQVRAFSWLSSHSALTTPPHTTVNPSLLSHTKLVFGMVCVTMCVLACMCSYMQKACIRIVVCVSSCGSSVYLCILYSADQLKSVGLETISLSPISIIYGNYSMFEHEPCHTGREM